MKTQQDLIALFKQVATEVDKREFRDVTGESVITDLGIDSLSMMQIVGVDFRGWQDGYRADCI